MKSTKLTRTLFAGMMTCSMALTAVSVSSFVTPGATQTVLAESQPEIPAEFTLNLHKLEVFDGREIENDGNKIPDLDLSGLAGVNFKIYNVTKEFYDARDDEKNKGKTNEQIAKLLSVNWDYGSPKGTLVDTVKTNGDGLATKQLATKTELDGNMVHSVYMFVEVADKTNPELINTPHITAPPFLLGMSDELALQPSVDLYAKNYGVQKDLLGDDGEALIDGYYSYDVGDLLNYVSTSPFPTKRAITDDNYKSLRFYDEMTKAGTDYVSVDEIYVIKNGQKVQVKDEFEAVFTKITSDDSGWADGKRVNAGFDYTLDLTNLSAEKQTLFNALLDTIGGQQLHFSYTMTINDEAEPYLSIGNKFYGQFTNDHGYQETVDDAPEVETGGHKFVKEDAKTEKGLNNAHFKITKELDGKTKYAKLWTTVKDDDGQDVEIELKSTNGIYKPSRISWVDEEDATTIISGKNGDKDGQLEVYGLEAGDYQLVETKAPTGYTFNDPITDFTVDKATVETQKLDSETVVNYRNDRILPITGGIGIVSFLAVGAMAMGGALYYKKKKA